MRSALLIFIVCLAFAAPAAASTVSEDFPVDGTGGSSPATATYAAAPGEANRLTVTVKGAVATFSDPAVVISAGTSCHSKSPHEAVCSLAKEVPLVTASLGDGNDRYRGPGHVSGDAGDDVLTASAAARQVSFAGGTGKDTLTGGRTADELFGEGGDDRLAGGAGDDVLEGGPGSDRLDGGTGHDTASFLNDAPGSEITADLLAGRATLGAERDTLRSIDSIYDAEHQPAVLRGTAGANRLETYSAHARLEGRNGNDELITHARSHDRLFGGAGNDVLDGSLGHDTLACGAGSDTADARFESAYATDPSWPYVGRDCERVAVVLYSANFVLSRFHVAHGIARATARKATESGCGGRVVFRLADGRSGGFAAWRWHKGKATVAVRLTAPGQAAARAHRRLTVRAAAVARCDGTAAHLTIPWDTRL